MDRDRLNKGNILQVNFQGDVVATWKSVREITDALGCHSGNLSLCLRHKNSIHKGFVWVYAVQKIQDGLSPKDIESVNRILLAFSQNSCKIIAPMVGKFENAIQRIFGSDLFKEK